MTAPSTPSGRDEDLIPVAVYEPTTLALPALRDYLHRLWALRSLMWNLARSQLKSENYDTVLGQVWLVLNPLLLAGVYLVVRGVLRPMGTPAERNMLIAHLIMGVFFFRLVSTVVQQGSNSIIRSKAMVLNTNFPKAIFPLTVVLKAVLDFVPMLVILFMLHAVLGQPFGASLLAVVPIWFLLMAFGTGAALLFATFTVYLRDTTNFLQYVLRLTFFMTPILYLVDEIPPGIRVYLELNPLFPAFWALEEAWQGRWPDPGLYLWFAAWALPLFVIGTLVFISKERTFAAHL